MRKKKQLHFCTLHVSHKVSKSPNKQKIDKELWWFDGSDNTYNIFRGGKLNFAKMEIRKGFDKINIKEMFRRVGDSVELLHEKEEKGKMVPVIEDDYSVTPGTSCDKEAISRFVDKYSNYNDTSVSVVDSDDDGVILRFENYSEKLLTEEIEDFTHNLEKEGFVYSETERG